MAQPPKGTRADTRGDAPEVARQPVVGEPPAIDVSRHAALDFGSPMTRPLKAYAFDPSQGRLLGNQMSMAVRYEELDPGPTVRDPFAFDGIAIVDYDATNDVYYHPVNLD